MSRFAIGYSPDDIDRPVAVFVETSGGVLFQRRGEAAPQMLDRPLGLNGTQGEIRPDDHRYFNAVLDSFSTRFFIRTAADLEPDVIVGMLLAEDNWDRLPRPGFTHVAA